MEARLNIGGNNPPSEIEILKQRLESYIKEDALIDQLANKQIPLEIEDDGAAGRVTDHIKSLKSVRGTVEKIFKAEKEPFLEACKVADSWKNVRWTKIDAAIATATKPILVWNKKKEDEERARQMEAAKKAQEEAERLALEAAAHADAGINDTAEELLNIAVAEEKKADAMAEKAEDVRGRSYGNFASASTRKVWVGEIESMANVDLEALRKYLTADDLEKAVRGAIKDGIREIKGVKIFEQDKLTIR